MEPYNFENTELDLLMTQWLCSSGDTGLIAIVVTGPSLIDPCNNESVLLVHPPVYHKAAAMLLSQNNVLTSSADESPIFQSEQAGSMLAIPDWQQTPLVQWRPLCEQSQEHERDLACVWSEKGCHGYVELVFTIFGNRAFRTYLMCKGTRFNRETQGALAWQALSFWPKIKSLMAMQASPLTARELQCLKMSFEGCTSRETGERLGIGERTVIFHIANSMKKMKVKNRLDAVRRAFWLGLM